MKLKRLSHIFVLVILAIPFLPGCGSQDAKAASTETTQLNPNMTQTQQAAFQAHKKKGSPDDN